MYILLDSSRDAIVTDMSAHNRFTQTDNDIHDVFSYKTRAYKAEVSYVDSLHSEIVFMKYMLLFPVKCVEIRLRAR